MTLTLTATHNSRCNAFVEALFVHNPYASMRNAHDDSSTASLQEAIASLHLPHMPETHDAPPTLRILVVADIDLASASALSEYTLNWNNSSKSIDLCIACGPFCRDDDLIPYLQGSQHRRRKRIYRSKEQAAGLEGLMTAALSQLESIVCRVVYCPGLTDPLTVLQQHRRLTPNSRNIHQQWLQLVPGLGCAGLLYLEQTTVALEAPTEEDRSDENGDEEEEKDEELSWAEQLRHLQHRYDITTETDADSTGLFLTSLCAALGDTVPRWSNLSSWLPQAQLIHCHWKVRKRFS